MSRHRKTARVTKELTTVNDEEHGSLAIISESMSGSEGGNDTVKQPGPQRQDKGYGLAMLILGAFAGLLHYYHVSTLYENDRHFSHLSNLEREMCFRSEMGLYYSFYKRIVRSQSFSDGIYNLTRDTLTEYPSSINAFGKFNIYPEAVVGGIFRLYKGLLDVLGTTGKECYTIHRGEGLPGVESCVGLGDPIFFYLEAVWIFAGLTALILFCYGTLLSGSVYGGCITIVSFFINHAESTRVQWTPPLRESFAYPIIVLHCMTVSIVLQEYKKSAQKTCYVWKEVIISLSSCVSLLFWQFSQFILSCELIILTAMYAIGVVCRRKFLRILLSISIGHVMALLGMMANRFLLFSFLSALVVVIWIVLIYDQKTEQLIFSWKSVLRVNFVIFTSGALKYSFPDTGNDSHIMKIFLNKIFEDLNDFHTLMYTCAPEFQGLPWSYGVLLTKSFLIPLIVTVLLFLCLSETHNLCALIGSFGSSEKSTNSQGVHEYGWIRFHTSFLYNFGLLIAFFALSMMAMRLKLFLTPQMCIIVSLIASDKVINHIPLVREKHSFRVAFLVMILASLCYFGSVNIKKQHNIEGEFSNYPLEELLTWIQRNTHTNDAFAGPMPITASILLSTGRPIVNHPYYEDKEIRERTLEVYSVFSRKPPVEAYNAIKRLGAKYAVLEANKCFDHRQTKPGCKMTNLWDIEDPKNVGRSALCPQLFRGDASPFLRVFKNSEYVILKVSTGNEGWKENI